MISMQKGFPATAYEKQPRFLSGLLLMMFAEITFCPSINLEEPVIVLFIFLTLVSPNLWNALVIAQIPQYCPSIC